ncbi:DUF2786 domain-containing protein [Pectobacterium brasiliense]|uniref:DUF2786 domain-containing protein n=1 Tax=Pectobacterium brasiliense TaxID=180957 RepID=UPI001969609D|nr:DUF2786 domain-containing protein [Pectobacterium brasiliense]MBN3174854.1 DUF2786 domain-containing protein [Pectobacterium brasiliense]MBN3200773.1 DUF2786 domain-containing protein [Pectobacterium brasiliense]MBN3206036.1 DUF2786 domain-containing protein [Pectobacterium brasiliense]
MNNEKYLNKIKKLLNLARRTTNANEAANAMSQAQALMRQHGLTETDVDLMAINEVGSKTAPSKAQKTPKYMAGLMQLICDAFGVQSYLSFKRDFLGGRQNTVIFYGPNERPQIAAYAFDVLSRQMMKARREFSASQRKNIKQSTKIARADTFCEGWVLGVWQVIDSFVVTDTEATLISAYHHKLQQRIGIKSRELRDAKKARGTEDARSAGYVAGKNASLHHAVNGSGAAVPARLGRL